MATSIKSIDELLVPSGNPIYYDTTFRNVLEAHVLYLKEHPDTKRVEISEMQAFKYEFDLNGLLQELTIKPELHYIVMRLNGLTTPTKVNEKLTSLLIPPEMEISKIYQSYAQSTIIGKATSKK